MGKPWALMMVCILPVAAGCGGTIPNAVARRMAPPGMAVARPAWGDGVVSFAFTQDGGFLALGSWQMDGYQLRGSTATLIKLKPWSSVPMKLGRPKGPAGAGSPLGGVASSPDGSLVALAFQDRIELVRTWDAGIVLKIPQEFALIRRAAISPDGKRLAVVSDIGLTGGRLRVLDLGTGAVIRQYRYSTPAGETPAPVWHSNSRAVVIRTVRGLESFETATGRNSTFVVPFPNVQAIAVSPRGTAMAASAGGRLLLWTGTNKRPRVLASISGNDVTCLAFFPDGARFVAGHYRSSVTIWSVQSGKRLRRWEAGGYYPAAIVTAGDGSTVIVAHADGTVVSWDAATGGMIAMRPTDAAPLKM